MLTKPERRAGDGPGKDADGPRGEDGTTGLASISSPERRRGRRLLAAARLAVSLALDAALAAMPGRSGRTLRDARGAEAALSLPTLGVIPRLVRSAAGRRPHQRLRDEPSSPYANAVSAVLAGLDVNGPGRPRVLLVTSSLPGEGKTTFAVSLATAAARSGNKVLVIDLDLRQPNAHRELGHEAEVGVVEVAGDGRPLDGVVRHDPATGLDLLPAGTRTAHPTELLESDAMRRLLDACRARYDLVVIDTAPVGVITDAGIAARLADKVVFVVRWGRTPGSAAREALRVLRGVGVEPVGVVLTQAGVGWGGYLAKLGRSA